MRNGGFSLLELVLALSIFAIGSVVAGYMIIDANTSTRQNIGKAEALLIARDSIEAVMSIRDADFCELYAASNNNPNGLTNLSGFYWDFIHGIGDTVDGKYLRQVFVTMDPDFTNTFTSTSTATVKVVVKWVSPRTNNTSDYTDEVSLSTILSNWRYGDDGEGNERELPCD